MKSLSINEIPKILPYNNYQCIFSLGGSCATAFQVKFRGLRTESLPFDWLFHTTKNSIIRLSLCFQENFVHWLEKENLRELTGEEHRPNNNLQYEDIYTGYRFIHDFHNSFDDEYPSIKEKYSRSIDRLLNKINLSQNCLAILNVSYKITFEDFLPLKKILEEKWPKTHFDFVIIQYSSEKEQVSKEENMYIIETKRSEGGYDYSSKTFEFSFLDTIPPP